MITHYAFETKSFPHTTRILILLNQATKIRVTFYDFISLKLICIF